MPEGGIETRAPELKYMWRLSRPRGMIAAATSSRFNFACQGLPYEK